MREARKRREAERNYWQKVGPKLMDALKKIAAGDGYYGSMAREYKNIARLALAIAEAEWEETQ